MRGKSILVLLIVGLLFASVGGVMAQVGAQVPAIVSFTADETDVLFSAVEAGTATVNLSWHI